MLRKGAIVVSDHKEDQVLSSLFLVKKKGGGNHPVVNLKNLNRNIPYQHFKMDELFLLKEMLLPGDKMCKIDLMDAYFAISLSVKSIKYVRFQWKGPLYEFFCLCFGISPAALVFTKLLKVSISLLRKLIVRIVICLDDMLLMASSLEDLLMAIDTLIFIRQHIGFLINIKKSYLEPTPTLEFLGVIVDSGEMTLSLPKEKLLKVQNHCEEIPEIGKVTVRELSNLTGRLLSTAIAVLPAPHPLFSSSISTDSEINLSEFFRGKSGNFDEGKERTVMMERKFNSLQGEIFSFSPTANNNKLRCIITRLGSELSRPDNRGAMVHEGTKVSYKSLGAQVSQISYNVLLTKRNRCNT